MADALPGGEVLVYQAPDGQVRVDVRLERDTVWLPLNQLAELFDRDKSVISRHLRNVFESGELERAATVAKNATVQTEAGRGVAREIEFFNLDAIPNSPLSDLGTCGTYSRTGNCRQKAICKKWILLRRTSAPPYAASTSSSQSTTR